MQRSVLQVAARGRGAGGGERRVLPSLGSVLREQLDAELDNSDDVHETLKEIGSRQHVRNPTGDIRREEVARWRGRPHFDEIVKPARGRGTAIKDGSLARMLMRDEKRAKPRNRTKTGHLRTEEERRTARTSGDRIADRPKRNILKDWANSGVRAEAVKEVQQGQREFAKIWANRSTRNNVPKPFSIAGLPDITKQIPAGHWTAGHVTMVGTMLERNGNMDPQTRQKIFSLTLETLNTFATREPADSEKSDAVEEHESLEEKYADAEVA